jgi:hypothetical protein
MPSIWTDVQTDPAITDELVRQLAAAAAAIGEALAVLEHDRPWVTEDWTGLHRQLFDDELGRLRRRGQRLVEELLQGVSVASTLQAAAEGEQRLRVRLRQQALIEAAGAPGGPA